MAEECKRDLSIAQSKTRMAVICFVRVEILYIGVDKSLVEIRESFKLNLVRS
ncbi:MAG: hypothetical protein ACJAYF_002747 [Arenicella sp.]|jgi:hypothetical protein